MRGAAYRGAHARHRVRRDCDASQWRARRHRISASEDMARGGGAHSPALSQHLVAGSTSVNGNAARWRRRIAAWRWRRDALLRRGRWAADAG